MRDFLLGVLLVLFASGAVVCVWQLVATLRAVERAVDDLPQALREEIRVQAEASRREIEATRRDLRAELERTRGDLRKELEATRRFARDQVRELLAVVDARLAASVEMLDRRTEQALGILDYRLGEVTSQVSASAADVDRMAVGLLGDTDRMVRDLHPQLLGLVAAGKVAMGDISQMTRTWKRETPEIASSVRKASGRAPVLITAKTLQAVAVAVSIVLSIIGLAR